MCTDAPSLLRGIEGKKKLDSSCFLVDYVRQLSQSRIILAFSTLTVLLFAQNAGSRTLSKLSFFCYLHETLLGRSKRIKMNAKPEVPCNGLVSKLILVP